ncbi:MAG: hypothetical protein ACI4R8_02915 [Candidatus Caccovivens sp.]
MKIFCSALLCMLVFVGTFVFIPNFSANAETFISAKIEDDNFSVTLSADARKSSILPLNTTEIETDVGSITYYIFEWKDLEDLHFRFQSNIENSVKSFTNFEFLLTHRKSEDLNDSLGGQDVEVLYRGNIANNNFPQFDFYYYIDSTSKITESATRCKGNDFGLYKFDFNYTYVEDDETHTISVGDFHIAVLPQNVDSIAQSDVKLMYSVASSNKLMNIYNVYLSNDTYKYVNPANLQWNVVGKDKMNINYVLSKSIKESNMAEYANYRVLYESPIEPTGTSFIFDSNDIEGIWTVTLTIKSQSSQDRVLQVAGLSTIKQAQTSYVWLVLLIIGIVIIIGVVILLIVLRKKRDKVW